MRTYLNKDNSVDALGFVVRPLSQIFEDVLKIGNEDIFNKMLVFLNVEVLQVYFLVAPVNLVDLVAEVLLIEAADCNLSGKLFSVGLG
jgi:hypothetical protein